MVDVLLSSAETVERAGAWAATLDIINTSASVVSAGANVFHVLMGMAAYRHLHDCARMAQEDLRAMEEAISTATNLQYQSDFPKTVYDQLKMRLYQTNPAEKGERRKNWFFIYHPSNEWFGGLHHHLGDDPPFGYVGTYSDLVIMIDIITRSRCSLRDRSLQDTIHALAPSAHFYTIKEKFQIPSGFMPFRVEGFSYQSMLPYVSVTHFGAPPSQDCFEHVQVYAWEPKTPSSWRKIGKTAGACVRI